MIWAKVDDGPSLKYYVLELAGGRMVEAHCIVIARIVVDWYVGIEMEYEYTLEARVNRR